jgi:glyoxylase-like metal-dependent hydrolase (beta-lactamase superfamily II)
MMFRQLFDRESSTYTYLIADERTKDAALVDPVLEHIERDLEIVRELGLGLVQVLDTHVHADHITAAGTLRERFGALTIGGEGGAPCVDRPVHHGDIIRLGSVEIHVLATPGHTSESVSFLMGDRVLTGDALLIRAAGRTDFQNGDAGELYDTLTRVLFRLPDETLVYPAHDYRGRTVSTIGEEKRFNTRVAGRTREEFIAVMNGLHLPEPTRLHDAVPANRACGVVPPPVQG